jgi:hypothetical protein
MNIDAARVIQERLKAILGMIIGVISVKEACARIMLSFTRCKQLRAIALQGSSGPALPLEEILPDARLALNANPTRRLSRHSPAQRWRDRSAISADLRVHFSALLKDSRLRIRAEEGIAPDAQLSHREQARIDCKAIRDGLLETHLLTIRSGDFGQGLLPRNAA